MSRRITARQVALIQRNLTVAEEHIIEHLAITKLASGRQLRILTDSVTVYQRRSLQRHLKHLTELRVLARLARRVGGVRAGSDSYVYALDIAGQRITEARSRARWRAPWTPSIRLLDHTLAVTNLYVGLIEAERHGLLDLLSFETEPGCWRTFVGPGGARMTLKPDAHVIVSLGELEVHAWIEMDMATESLAWITEKAKTYGRYYATGKEQARHGVFPKALWIAPDQTRAKGLIDALGRLPAEHWQLHQVTTMSEAPEALLMTPQHHLNGEPRP